MGELDRDRLLERVQEQESVIRQLWDRYRQDVGREPDVNDLVSDGSPAATTAHSLRNIVGQEQTFSDAVDEFEVRWTRTFPEASAQRVGAKLLHDRKPVAASCRRACDVVLHGFWGRGVSMPAFERLLEKLRPAHVYRLDFSDNGMNGNFVPGIVEVLRRGVRQLNLSSNELEAQAACTLLLAAPQTAPFLESLDFRNNPCQNHTGFLTCMTEVVHQLKHLDRLVVTVRCDASASTEPSRSSKAPGAQSVATPQRRAASAGRLAQSRGRATSPGRPWRPPAEKGSWSRAHRFGAEAAAPQAHVHRQEAPATERPGREPSPWRLRSMSQSGASAGRAIRRRSPSAGREPSGRRQAALAGEASDAHGMAPRSIVGEAAAVALFRSIAQCPQLRVLDLRSSSLTCNAVQRLAHHVRDARCQLMSLCLAHCFLGQAVEPLLGAVGASRGLVNLDLRLNAISDQSGVPLCSALRSSISLTDVNLSSNELGDNFGINFAKVVAVNDVLWKVDLTRNPLGVDTGDALLEVLKRRRGTPDSDGNRRFAGGLVSIGDTTDSLFGLGMQNRRQIQRYLAENSSQLEAPRFKKGAGTTRGDGGPRPEHLEVNGLKLEDFEWSILEELPRPLEPLMLLL